MDLSDLERELDLIIQPNQPLKKKPRLQTPNKPSKRQASHDGITPPKLSAGLLSPTAIAQLASQSKAKAPTKAQFAAAFPRKKQGKKKPKKGAKGAKGVKDKKTKKNKPVTKPKGPQNTKAVATGAYDMAFKASDTWSLAWNRFHCRVYKPAVAKLINQGVPPKTAKERASRLCGDLKAQFKLHFDKAAENSV